MLAETSEPFDSPDYYFEPKWDGLRCLAFVRGRKVDFQNRNLRNVTRSYPELAEITRHIALHSAILDGEIVVLERGLPSFEKLQNRFGVENNVQVRTLANKIPATYIAFDLLHANGHDLIDRPLSHRKERLRSILSDAPHLLFSQYVPERGRAYFRNAVKLGFEGVMAKKASSAYHIGSRSNDWLKIKHIRSTDAIVAGYTKGTGSRTNTFGALVLAAYDENGKLVHMGNVGTGFSDKRLEALMRLLRPLRMKTRQIEGEVKAPAPITWVKPRLVAEIGYVSITGDGKLRFPRFLKLRLDEAASNVRLGK